MSSDKLVIIGGVAAGLAAAMEARRLAPALDITVLERTGDVSYGACGLPYVVARRIPSLQSLVVHAPEYFRERHRIDLRLHCEARELLPARALVRYTEEGEQRETGYTSLVIATGAAAICPPLPGRDLAGIFVVRHMRDGRRMLRFIEERRPERAVVVGAGYIGLEMAEAFRERGMKTTLVEASDKVMSTLGGRGRDVAADELRAHGVEVVFGERVAAFEGAADGGAVTRVVTESGKSFEADIVSIGVGVRPEIALARDAGLEIGESGAVVVDERQRTSAAGVFAAGDCCEVLNRVSGRRVWNPLGQPAVRQGWTAGANAAREDAGARYAGVVGTNAVKLFNLELARTGLSLEEARSAGFDATETETESVSRAGYYPGGSKIHTCLVADRTGRLLGAQMVGREGVAQRVNLYAAALHAGMKVDDVERLDLAYSPPFAPTIDPVLRAAHAAAKIET